MGTVYNLPPKVEPEEKYSVKTGANRIGLFSLDTTNLDANSYLPSFTPICADLAKKTAKVVRNAKVTVEATATDVAIKVAKGSLFVTGMFIGNGSKGGTITAVDKTNADYDLITVGVTLGVKLVVGTVLFEATSAGGTVQKNVANSALYGRWQVVSGPNNITLLRTAAEIEPSKLTVPFSSNDKAAMAGWFQFNE